MCRACPIRFVSREGLGHQHSVKVIAAAITTYLMGASLRKTASSIQWEFGVPTTVSTQTISQWVKTYTSGAVQEMVNHKASTSGCWMVYHMCCSAGDAVVVVDQGTRYILAACFRFPWDVEMVREVIHKALASTPRRERLFSCVFETDDLNQNQIKEANRVMLRSLPPVEPIAFWESDSHAWLMGCIDRNLPDWGGAPPHRGRFRSIDAAQRCLDGAVIMLQLFQKAGRIRRSNTRSDGKCPCSIWKLARRRKEGFQGSRITSHRSLDGYRNFI